MTVPTEGEKKKGNAHTLRIGDEEVLYDLNEFNHAMTNFASVSAFEEARAGYLDQQIAVGQEVGDSRAPRFNYSELLTIFS